MKLRTPAAWALAIAACGGAVELVEDLPIAAPPKAGRLAGVILPAGNVAQLTAVSRVSGREYQPADFDRKTGRFVFGPLAGDATYDICVRTADGRRIEGIDLNFVDARMVRLADRRRAELALPAERERPFTGRDAGELTKFVADMKDFCEIRRVLYIRGWGRRATMLVELMRTRDFHASSGECIWRVELWYFENFYGGWARLANQERVLRRERISPRQWRKIHVEYYPQLSMYVDPAGVARSLEFRLGDRPDPSRGRAAGTAPRLKTAPHVLGLDVEPTTKPPALPGDITF